MPDAETSGPFIDGQHQLEAANVQLVLYSRNLNGIADAKRHTASKLNAAYQQLPAYARALKMVFNAEHSNTRGLKQVSRGALHSHRTDKSAFDHAKTYGITLYGDGRMRREHFDPPLLAVFRAIHQAFEVIDC